MRTRINFNIIIMGIIIFALNPPEGVSAGVSDIPPSVACGLLNSISLPTQGWKQDYDDTFGCRSQSIQFGSSQILQNNLSYSVEGNSGTVKELVLVLSVNNIAEAQEAHSLLLQVAQKLLVSVTHKPMPDNMIDAILHRKNYSFINDGINVTTKISYWIMKSIKLNTAIARGYEMRFIIQ
jgi:hypothetical protein